MALLKDERWGRPVTSPLSTRAASARRGGLRMRRTGYRSRRLLVMTALWLAYAVYEGVMFIWAQQVIAPIRIDLIVLAPVVYVVTGIGIVWRLRSKGCEGST